MKHCPCQVSDIAFHRIQQHVGRKTVLADVVVYRHAVAYNGRLLQVQHRSVLGVPDLAMRKKQG